ncbi:10146_t:CDS:2, partial [Acaulospora colombiana]
ADSSLWPSTSPISDHNGYKVYYQRVNKNEKKYNLYATKVGEFLARALEEELNKKIRNRKLASLPQGYALFDRVREGKKGVIRRDTYLFGKFYIDQLDRSH